MKARVKGTTDIIEVEFNKDALNACYPPYYDKEHHMYYQPEQLEWVDYEANAEPDYWEKLKHQYAGMAMQGIVMNEKMQYDLYQAFGKNESMDVTISEFAIDIANTLVEKLKGESNG